MVIKTWCQRMPIRFCRYGGLDVFSDRKASFFGVSTGTYGGPAQSEERKSVTTRIDAADPQRKRSAGRTHECLAKGRRFVTVPVVLGHAWSGQTARRQSRRETKEG